MTPIKDIVVTESIVVVITGRAVCSMPANFAHCISVISALSKICCVERLTTITAYIDVKKTSQFNNELYVRRITHLTLQISYFVINQV
jgi:hypothetical protein